MLISADILDVELQLSTEGATKTSYHKTPFNSITTNYGQILCDVNFKLTLRPVYRQLQILRFIRLPSVCWVR